MVEKKEKEKKRIIRIKSEQRRREKR